MNRALIIKVARGAFWAAISAAIGYALAQVEALPIPSGIEGGVIAGAVGATVLNAVREWMKK